MPEPTPSPAPASEARPMQLVCDHCGASYSTTGVIQLGEFHTGCGGGYFQLAAPTPESPREAGTPCSYAGPGVCPHCFPAAPTTEGPQATECAPGSHAYRGAKGCVCAAPRPGAPEEGIIPQDADLVRRIVRDAQRRPLSGTETVYLRSLAASLAALTSEVAGWKRDFKIMNDSRIKLLAEVARLTEERTQHLDALHEAALVADGYHRQFSAQVFANESLGLRCAALRKDAERWRTLMQSRTLMQAAPGVHPDVFTRWVDASPAGSPTTTEAES